MSLENEPEKDPSILKIEDVKDNDIQSETSTPAVVEKMIFTSKVEESTNLQNFEVSDQNKKEHENENEILKQESKKIP